MMRHLSYLAYLSWIFTTANVKEQICNSWCNNCVTENFWSLDGLDIWDKVLAPIECNRSFLVQYAILSLHAVGKIVQSGASYTGMINEDYGLLDPLMFGSWFELRGLFLQRWEDFRGLLQHHLLRFAGLFNYLDSSYTF